MASNDGKSDTFTISNNTHSAPCTSTFWNKIKSTFSLAITPIAGKIF